MWLFTKNSFISIVQHRKRPDDVLVRGRVKKHLDRLFPDKASQIQRDDEADYRWRLIIPKQELADRISAYIMQSLDYDNFKAAQETDDPAWQRFLHAVWGEGLRLQSTIEQSEKEAWAHRWIDRFKRHRIGKPHKIDINFIFSQEQFEKIKQGFTPREMEDKWGIYYSKSMIYFHRSWSHYRVYQAKIEKHGDKYTIKSFYVERNQKKYSNTDDNEDIAIFSFLIANLLGIDASEIFSSSKVGETGALQLWSTFGRMFFQEKDSLDSQPDRSEKH